MPEQDAVHQAFTKCSRVLQQLPEADAKRVVKAMAILLEIIPYDHVPGGGP